MSKALIPVVAVTCGGTSLPSLLEEFEGGAGDGWTDTAILNVTLAVKNHKEKQYRARPKLGKPVVRLAC